MIEPLRKGQFKYHTIIDGFSDTKVCDIENTNILAEKINELIEASNAREEKDK